MSNLTSECATQVETWWRNTFNTVTFDLLGREFAEDHGLLQEWGDEWERVDDWRMEVARENLTIIREVRPRQDEDDRDEDDGWATAESIQVPPSDQLEFRWIVRDFGGHHVATLTEDDVAERGILQYPDDHDDLVRDIITSLVEDGSYEPEDTRMGFPAAWDTCWVHRDLDEGDLDRSWGQEFVQKATAAGFLVYRFRGYVVLCVDGAGYTFMDQHFAPLWGALTGNVLQWRDGRTG